ncbi:hypothetical protein [Bacillus wiedmannii]|uniref:hypothetical protein n=1 Tax=Bacillus wiedmannii TaxID=1890302 RepID=UPI000BEFB5B5|nr:hypothetical protein [Bacillus wiedmannii]PEN61623.1 hypothetical protein CN576_21560 [Bacillus wiedmannii]PHA62869.1 hypothetical protein COE75_16665 [Bacillus wiedmannii]
MVCSTGGANYITRVCTDAALYTARATSIDCTVEADSTISGLYTWDYKVELQEFRPDMGVWMAVDSKTGYFKMRAYPSFSLGVRRSGTYRVKFERKRRDGGSWSTSYAGSLTVQR